MKRRHFVNFCCINEAGKLHYGATFGYSFTGAYIFSVSLTIAPFCAGSDSRKFDGLNKSCLTLFISEKRINNRLIKKKLKKHDMNYEMESRYTVKPSHMEAAVFPLQLMQQK